MKWHNLTTRLFSAWKCPTGIGRITTRQSDGVAEIMQEATSGSKLILQRVKMQSKSVNTQIGQSGQGLCVVVSSSQQRTHVAHLIEAR